MANVHTHIGGGGRIVIPAEYRKKLGMGEGDEVIVSCDTNGIRISTPEMALKQLQHIARTRLKKRGKHSVVDAFIAERRREALEE